jgi:Trp operon repressor
MNDVTQKAKGVAKFLLLSQEEGGLVDILPVLMTPIEIEKIYERIRILECLNDGLSQRKTLKKTGSAIATVTRGAKVLKQVPPFFGLLIKKAQHLDWWRHLFWCA